MDSQQLPDNQEDQEVFLREHNAKNFIASVARAKEERAFVLLTLRAFYREPDVLYVALAYASEQGIEVRVTPQTH